MNGEWSAVLADLLRTVPLRDTSDRSSCRFAQRSQGERDACRISCLLLLYALLERYSVSTTKAHVCLKRYRLVH
jgi:hypothetical protein